MEKDYLDNQWITLNLVQTMEKMNECARELKTIACQKAVPTRESIERWLSFGETHRNELKALLRLVEGSGDYRFVDVTSGYEFDIDKTEQLLHMFVSALDFYEDARFRAHKRLADPTKQIFA